MEKVMRERKRKGPMKRTQSDGGIGWLYLFFLSSILAQPQPQLQYIFKNYIDPYASFESSLWMEL